MTCIVAIASRGKVFMGADSAGICGERLEIRQDKKLFFLGSRYLLGFTSSFRMGQLLMTLDLPDPPEASSPSQDHRFVVTTLVPIVREHLRNGGFLRDLTIQNPGYTDHRSDIGGLFLLGFSGQLFEISDDFGVAQADHGYMAVGAGAPAARGSLFSTHCLTSPRRRLELALEAAAFHSWSTRAPFHFLDLGKSTEGLALTTEPLEFREIAVRGQGEIC